MFSSLDPGGLENGVVNISNNVEGSRFDSTIICLQTSGSFERRLNPNVRVYELRKRSGFRFSVAVELAKLVKKVRPDLIHTHNLGPLVYTVLAKTLSFSRVPILHGEHGTASHDTISGKRLWQRVFLYRFCRKIHTVSNSLREDLIKQGLPGEKISAIQNGVDCEKFQPRKETRKLREELELPIDSVVIGIVGRLISSKRHQLALESLNSLGELVHPSKFFLVVIGDKGDAKDEIIQCIQNHPFPDRIRWVGHQQDPAPWYNAIDLVLMPSVREGLSNVILESMASGVPCIAHPACGASEVIIDEKNGILKPIDSAADLVNILKPILEDKQILVPLSKEARATALSSFSIEKMVSAYENVYLETAGFS